MQLSTDFYQSLNQQGVDVSSAWCWCDKLTYDPTYKQVLTQPFSLESLTLNYARWKDNFITLTIRKSISPTSAVLFSGEIHVVPDDDSAATAVINRTSTLVTKTNHGFAVGQPVNLTSSASGNVWSLAKADTDFSLFATHLVVDVPDANSFRVAQAGYWSMTSSIYGITYLGATAGSMVATPPAGLSIQQLGISDGAGIYITIAYPRDISPE